MKHVPIIQTYDARFVRSEVYKTRLRMWLAFIFATSIASMVGAAVRRQPFIPDVPWWVTPLSAITVLIVCYWLGDRMFHGLRGGKPR